MSRVVFCQLLKKEAPGLESVPYPGELGERIFENISSEAWSQWLQQLTMIINENRLSTADPASIGVIEQFMVGFLFKEGNGGGAPQTFTPPGAKK